MRRILCRRRAGSAFDEAMTGAGIEFEAVKALQFADALEGVALEGALAVEGVEDDAFEEVAESEVVVLGESFEDFEKALFHAHAGLHALNREARVWIHPASICYQCTVVTK